MLSIALLIGRLLVAPNNPAPPVTDRGVLFIKRHQIIDPCASNPDAGVPDGGLPDAQAPDATVDAGPGDAGVPDAGVPDGGTCAPIEADTITMIVQPELGALYSNTSFALLYVTPARPQVTNEASDVFGELARATAPMIETQTVYVEDPGMGQACSSGCGGGQPQQQQSSGCGGYESSSWDPPSVRDAGADTTGIETVGPYEIVRAHPANRQELTALLTQLGYAYAPQDLDAVEPYLALGYHVVAARAKATSSLGRRMTPLAFTWQGTEIRVPVALGHTLTQPLSDVPLTVFVAAESRYELPDATVNFAMRTSFMSYDTGFLTRNDIVVDTTLPASADPMATATGAGEYRATEIVTNEVHVPVSVYCDDNDVGLCSDCSAGTKRRQIDFGTILLGLVFALRRRAKRRGHRKPRRAGVR